jgi:hypothetical protein
VDLLLLCPIKSSGVDRCQCASVNWDSSMSSPPRTGARAKNVRETALIWCGGENGTWNELIGQQNRAEYPAPAELTRAIWVRRYAKLSM